MSPQDPVQAFKKRQGKKGQSTKGSHYYFIFYFLYLVIGGYILHTYK